MSTDDRDRLADIHRAITPGIQRYARAAERATGARLIALMAEFRVYTVGIRHGLMAMGMTESGANEAIAKAGWDFKTNSYRVFERPSLFTSAAAD